jgi:large subunit ribosomal protein L5
MAIPTLKERYLKVVRPALAQEFGLGNVERVPRLKKIVVNMGFGIVDKDALKVHTAELAAVTGQKPLVTRARKSISNFKLRAGMNIGAKVTLRGDRMYEFMHRFVSAALPRIRDFRGLSGRAFDRHGNYTLGVKEQTIFPEIDPNAVTAVQGMDITFVTTAPDAKEAKALLRGLGLPFADK